MRFAAFMMALCLVLTLAGCKSRKEGEEPVRRGGRESLEAHRLAETEFRTLVFKGKAEYVDDVKNEEVSFAYKVSIARDSLILANITKLGLPAANILITEDSVLMRLPLNKEAVRCDIDMLQDLTGMKIGFSDLQDILVGDLKVPANAQMDGESYVVAGKNNEVLSYTLGGNHLKLEKMVMKEPKFDRELVLSYDKFKKSGGQWLPWKMALNRMAPGLTSIKLTHTDIDLDGEDANFSFRIPDGYATRPCEAK